ncbi:hypothetical protein JKP88DRAFT_350472 [Tribonema minus]|uniref:Uncharacterized protein n=1 Tax=Tribonema minus TaxID=303371 RepID=A0A835YWW7_9STRA|nr:hypothetical protein JKP88DRAFT_350472 [Tribonema minus]
MRRYLNSTDAQIHILRLDPERGRRHIRCLLKDLRRLQLCIYSALQLLLVMLLYFVPGISQSSSEELGYWLDSNNVRKELDRFWQSKGVESSCVPSYLLLQYFEEGGLAWGISQWGGGQRVGQRLGVPVMPSRWAQAVNTTEVQALMANGHLSADSATTGPYGGAAGLVKHGTARFKSVRLQLLARDVRQRFVKPGSVLEGRPKVGYKPRNYWRDFTNLERQIFDFLRVYQPAIGQPMVWLPRRVEFERAGRADIAQAITRLGGPDMVAGRHALVPHSQWAYFDKHLSVLKDLQSYIEQFGVSGYMPPLKELDANGFSRLRDGIAWAGGAKLLAAKLDMQLTPRNHRPTEPPPKVKGLTAMVATDPEAMAAAAAAAADSGQLWGGVVWGDFDLDFAVDLMEYVKSQSYRRELGEASPAVRRGEAFPWWDSEITMPFRTDLLADRQTKLVLKIEEYGGFENVARRLQLVYEDRDLKELRRLHASAAIQYRAARARQLSIGMQQANGVSSSGSSNSSSSFRSS